MFKIRSPEPTQYLKSSEALLASGIAQVSRQVSRKDPTSLTRDQTALFSGGGCQRTSLHVGGADRCHSTCCTALGETRPLSLEKAWSRNGKSTRRVATAVT